MIGNAMKIHNRPFGLQIPDYSLARECNLYGLWDNDTQELAFSCEYEYLRAIHDHYIIFQKNGRRGLMYYDGRILFENKYDDIGFIELRSAISLFVWYKERNLYHIATIHGEILMRNLPDLNIVSPDLSETHFIRYPWSNYCVWSTDYSRCRSPLNLLIDELDYPLAFASLDETFDFGRNASSSKSSAGLSLQEQANWVIAGWYHIARRLDELATRFGFVYHMAFLTSPLFLDTLGCCYKKAKVLIFRQELLRQPPIVVDALLIHELCHLKYFHHGTTFWTLVKNVALELGHEMIWEYDWVMENFINYNSMVPLNMDASVVINEALNKLYNMLSVNQRERLPLQKIPL